MRRYGKFVPQSTIERRMNQKDERIARETAARTRKAMRADLFNRLVGWAVTLEMTAFGPNDTKTAELLREAAAELVVDTDAGLAARVRSREFPAGIPRAEGRA